MDREIKRLLKLSNIPGFNLAEEEVKKLKAWKKKQQPVRPRKPRAKKTTNEVKSEEKETGAIELEAPVINRSVEES